MISNWVLVALGGGLGAVLRFAVSEAIPSEGVPWATLSVNLVGSLLLGAMTAAVATQVMSESQAMFLGMGLLGAFTTMSTYSVETIGLIEDGKWRVAVAYVLLTAAAGPILAWIGWKSGNAMLA